MNGNYRYLVQQVMLAIVIILGTVFVTIDFHGAAAADSKALSQSQSFKDGQVNEAVRLLRNSAGGNVNVSLDPVSGAARFVGFEPPFTLHVEDDSPRAVAGEFLARYGAVFGIQDPGSELDLYAVETDYRGDTLLTYEQRFASYPVAGGVLKLLLDEDSAVVGANGFFFGDIDLPDLTPAITVDEAAQIAQDLVAQQFAPDLAAGELSTQAGELLIYRRGQEGNTIQSDHLVFPVVVANLDAQLEELLYIDARTGVIILQSSILDHALGRYIYQGTFNEDYPPSTLVWEEGDPDPIPPDWPGGTPKRIENWQNMLDGAADAYYLFANLSGGQYLLNGGSDYGMEAVLLNGCQSPNASYSARLQITIFCPDVTGDDTVVHEWAHGVSDILRELGPSDSSDALNESFSDIWGEVADLLNERGADQPNPSRPPLTCSANQHGANESEHAAIDSLRWLNGEDNDAYGAANPDGNNAIRDLSDPTCFGDPGKVSDVESCKGGAHSRGGVSNHAFSLLVDGGSYNGQAIAPLGLTKSAHLFWSTHRRLTRTSNFADLADLLQNSCNNLIGWDLPALNVKAFGLHRSGEIITAADCENVERVIDAVEFRDEGCTDYEPTNDEIDNAIDIADLPYANRQDVASATSSAGDPTHPCVVVGTGYHTVWYRITPDSDLFVDIDTFGSGYDTILALWRLNGNDLVLESCNDDVDIGEFDSQLLDNWLNAGETYLVEIASFSVLDGNDASELWLNFEEQPGTIVGQVTAAEGGSNLAQIQVAAWLFDEDSGIWNAAGATTTAGNGSYQFDGLTPGAYRIQFAGNLEESTYAPQFYAGAAAFLGSQTIDLAPGTYQGDIDASLVDGGHIAGLVTAAGGAPLPDIRVKIYCLSCAPNFAADWALVKDTTTNEHGQYAVGGLATGTYRAEFRDSNGLYLPQDLDDTPETSATADIPVVAGQVTVVDISLSLPTPPPHDPISAAFEVNDSPYTSQVNTMAATLADSDPTIPCVAEDGSYPSVWYTFIPDGDGEVTIDTKGSDYKAVLALWHGQPGNLTLIACDEETWEESEATLENIAVSENTDYYLMVAPAWAFGGNLQLNVLSDVLKNTAPSAAPDAYMVTAAQTLTISEPGVLANDTDLDGDNLTATVSSAPQNGSLDLAPNGGFTYTPDSGFYGSDAFQYRAGDGVAQSDPAAVTLFVSPEQVFLPVAAKR